MDELFATIGRLYVEISRLQQYAELLQNKNNELEARSSEIANQVSTRVKDNKDSK